MPGSETAIEFALENPQWKDHVRIDPEHGPVVSGEAMRAYVQWGVEKGYFDREKVARLLAKMFTKKE